MKISAQSYFYCWFLSPVTLTLNKIGCCNATQSSVTRIGSHLPSFLCTSSLGFASYCWVKFHSSLDYNLCRRNDFSLLSLSCSFSLSSILNLPSKAWEWFWLQRNISPSHPWLAPRQCRVSLSFHAMPLGLSYQSTWPDYQAAVGCWSTGSSDPSIAAV